MQRYVANGDSQGAVTAVARRGQVLRFAAHGLLNVETGQPMRHDSIFRMASSSKPVLGVAAMIAIGEGRFDPTDSVAQFLPEFETMQVAA